LFIVVPLLAAALTLILRRFQTISAFLATGVAATLGVAALRLPLGRAVEVGGRQVALGEPVELLGRQLALGGPDRIVLASIFLVAAGLFFIGWPPSILGGWRAHPGSSFFALGLAILGLLSMALVVRPFVYASLVFAIAATLTAILVQGGTPRRTRGALRYLVMMTLALPGFLVASWLVDLYTVNPTDAGLARGVTLGLSAGFALLLSVVPFHIWIGPVADESPPVATVFVLTVFNSVAWFLLLDVLQEYTWLSAQPDVFRIIQFLGLLTAVVGGVLAFSSQDFTHVLGYGVLADYGCALIALGTRTFAGLATVILATLARPVSLAILALGITLARQRVKSSEFAKLTGLGWSSPWMAAALVVGGFSLAGIPPLAGFVGRWSQAQLLASTQPIYAMVMLGVTLSVAAGALRGMDYLLQPPLEAPDSSTPRPRLGREPRLMIAFILCSLVVGLFFGLFPGAVESAVRSVVSSYTFFSTP
jgi:formate hydrogenlyase subunit 3/multisubunit Na+/H+ antiporter MnhD subunit